MSFDKYYESHRIKNDVIKKQPKKNRLKESRKRRRYPTIAIRQSDENRIIIKSSTIDRFFMGTITNSIAFNHQFGI